jgi:GDP-mannose transporter
MIPSRALLLCYCVLSIAVTVCNKIILTMLKHTNVNFFILFSQSVIILLLLRVSSYTKLISYEHMKYERAKTWIPITTLLIASIYSNNRALQYLPISYFNIIKGFGVVLVAIGDSTLFTNKNPQRKMENTVPFCLSKTFLFVIVITLSNVILMLRGLTLFESEGLLWAITNCVACALYTLYTKHHRIQYPQITHIDYVYYNTVLSIPVLFAFSLWMENGEIFTIPFSVELLIMLTISSMLTFLLTYVISIITKLRLATNYTIVACLNKIPMNMVSMLIFSDESFTMRHIFSMLCATVGVYLIS